MRITIINPTSNQNEEIEIIKDITGGDYPTKAGLYITRDYGDGRIDIEKFDGQENWEMVCDGVFQKF